jgi:hypothetical protein
MATKRNALGQCRVCGGPAARDAQKCQTCGARWPHPKAYRAIGIMALILMSPVLLIIAVVIAAVMSDKTARDESTQQSPAAAATVEAAVPIPSAQQILDARLALCAAAKDEYADVIAGKGHKDAIILAGQFYVGEKAGGRAIGHEWFEYKDGRWHDSDCRRLSTARWAADEGYIGGPINLPDGAIRLVVNSGGWAPPIAER